MLDNETPTPGLPLTVRSVFVIDPSKKVRLTFTYPASCGRNFTEILRVVDSLQTTDTKKVVTPANWKKGDDVIIPPTINNVIHFKNVVNF
jgi:alkyl hydroperoxide reductase subunit AhpC